MMTGTHQRRRHPEGGETARAGSRVGLNAHTRPDERSHTGSRPAKGGRGQARREGRWWCVGLLVGLLGVLGWSASGAAAIVTVNVLTDNVGESCPTTCSLRAALAMASAGDEIQFRVSGTILLSQGQLVVDTDVTITGPGESSLAIDGNQASRVLQVNSGVTATLSGLTIQNGSVNFDNGGGIANYGDLTLTNCTMSGNSASFGIGGGIANFGTLTLTNCTLNGNSGVGIVNFGTLTLGNCMLNDNSGSGIFTFGTATLTNCTLSGNSGDRNSGGAIENFGTATLTNCTISGNSGGIGGIANHGDLTLTNCTISGNRGGGGGIFNDVGTLTLASSIVANSTGGENCFGTPITSHGDNLSSDATCVATDTTLNDRNNTDPQLDPAGLQDNGGPTLTIALQPTSPALDAVLHNTCPPPATDQRGVSRPVGARCDIGAFEFEGALPNVNDLVTFTPLPATFTTTADSAGCPAGFVGTFRFAARLTAKASSPALTDLQVQVHTLTNGNLLQNADGGPGGVGATLTVPQADGFADGLLSPEESVDVPFVVCLQQISPFRFFVDVLGERQ